jgi:hypothetical protein
MMTRLQIAFASVLSLMFCTLPVAAKDTPTVISIPSTGITLSSAKKIDSTIESLTWPVKLIGCFSDGRSADGLTLVHHAVNLQNDGADTVISVRMRFTFYDSFNKETAVHTNIATIALAPTAAATRVNLAEWSDAGPPSRVICAVDAVRYADGRIVDARTNATAKT